MSALHELANRIAKDLPDGYVISINMEKGSAWVNLEDSDGFSIQYNESPDDTLEEQVEKALLFAIEFEKKHD